MSCREAALRNLHLANAVGITLERDRPLGKIPLDE